jgi:hypothetical protein
MRAINLIYLLIGTAVISFSAPPSHAQHPVCAPPSSSETYLAVCRPGLIAIHGAATILSRFSVDHLFKPPQIPFMYAPAEIAAPFIGRQSPEIAEFFESLRDLPDVRFSRLDRSTGTLVANFEDAQRTFHIELEVDDHQPQISLQLPLHLEGGYWRAPDVLQMIFWKDYRPSITFEVAGRRVIDSEVACVSMSAGSLKIDLVEEDQPGIVLSLGGCE